MDSKTLTHIGGELIVMAGISFYFQKKCNKLEEQNKELVEAVNVLNQEFDSMYRAVKAIQDRMGTVNSTSSSHSTSSSSHSKPHHSQHSQHSHSVSREIPQVSTLKSEPEPEILEDDPDLIQELDRIKAERTVEVTEECKDGICLIKP